jgi:hypothetical protein
MQPIATTCPSVVEHDERVLLQALMSARNTSRFVRFFVAAKSNDTKLS